MRNPSKNTCKKLMRRAWDVAENGGLRFYEEDWADYVLFNWVGARLYKMSKGKICNLEPKGYRKNTWFTKQCQYIKSTPNHAKP